MEPTRASLLFRLKDAADASAWLEFDAIYRPIIHRFARVRGLADADADDITQQCMSVVHQHIRGFEYDPTKGRFKGWLKTMVNNRVRNFFRDRKDVAAETADLRRPEGREDSPEEAFDRVWMDEHLRHCLEQIRSEVGEATYAAFRGYVLEERPVEEICSTHKMTPNQVYQIKWRVTQKLGEKMKELVGEAE